MYIQKKNEGTFVLRLFRVKLLILFSSFFRLRPLTIWTFTVLYVLLKPSNKLYPVLQFRAIRKKEAKKI